MRLQRIQPSFENPLSRTQVILGWVYVAVHIFLLPELLDLYARFSPDPVSDTVCNFIWYGVGIVFCLTILHSLLRDGFDVLADNLGRCLVAMLLAFFLDYVLSGVAGLALMLLESASPDMSQETVMEAVRTEPGVKAATIFLAPIVEECLFRGVVFGSIRARSRVWAFVISAAVFAAYHVWGYAINDPGQWIYLLEYLPISVALAWLYERTGSIWPPIFFHMGINAMSVYITEVLQNL